jgi:hypothetical protein
MGSFPATDRRVKPRLPDMTAFADALIPITVALHLSRSTRELGLLSLFSWIVLKPPSRIVNKRGWRPIRPSTSPLRRSATVVTRSISSTAISHGSQPNAIWGV